MSTRELHIRYWELTVIAKICTLPIAWVSPGTKSSAGLKAGNCNVIRIIRMTLLKLSASIWFWERRETYLVWTEVATFKSSITGHQATTFKNVKWSFKHRLHCQQKKYAPSGASRRSFPGSDIYLMVSGCRWQTIGKALPMASFCSNSSMTERHISLRDAKFNAFPNMNRPSRARDKATVGISNISNMSSNGKERNVPFVRFSD